MSSRRGLTVFLPVIGRYEDVVEGLVDDPSAWLPDPHPDGRAGWRIDVGAAGVTRPVICRVGDPRWVGQSVWRTIEWVPAASIADVVPVERVLPSLDAELGVVQREERTALVLDGHYGVPAGRIGLVADMSGLNLIARRSATRFLDAVSQRLDVSTEQSTEPSP